MKLTRLNWVLAGVLLLVVGADQALRGQGPAEREVGRLLPDLFLDKAQRVVLEGGGKRLELLRVGEGVGVGVGEGVGVGVGVGVGERVGERVGVGDWVLPDHYDYPADAGRVRFLIERLITITTLDLLTVEAEGQAEYGVGDDALSVSVWDGNGQLLAGLLQGDEVPGGAASYVRRSGDDATYRAPRLRTIPVDAGLWLDVKWMMFEPTMVDRLELSGTELDAPIVLVRDERTVDKWRYEGGEVLAPSRVKSMLQTLRALFLAEVVGDGREGVGLGEVRLKVELRLADGRVMGGSFGTVSADGSVLAARAETGWVVRFPRVTWENLRREARGLAR